jgi:hypothetical protein
VSSAWAPLLPIAMIGTDRQAAPLPAWPGPIGVAVDQAAQSAGDPATAALRAAAVLAACGLAGVRGRVWSEGLPDAAPDDSRPALADTALIHKIRWAFADAPGRLHHEILAAIAGAGLRLPPSLLPHALELGRRSIALRPALLPVLGERGVWLAAQRDDWRYAAGVPAGVDVETTWIEGGFEQRRALLAAERRRAPAAARERLAQTLAALPARERADFAGELAAGLSAEDEPVLETLRADRSKDVRQVALKLLLRLPRAAHPQRAMGRLAPLLVQERVRLRQRWQVDAPAAIPDDWKADNIEAVRPARETLGERAWWLYQLVRQVPLAWWSERTGLDAPRLIEWAATTDWTEALLRGWRDVLFATSDHTWADALLDRWPAEALRDDPSAVLALLPAARRERHWLRQVHAGGAPLPPLVPQILAACPPGDTLSEPMSTALVDAMHALAARDALAGEYLLRPQLPELAAALHLSVVDRLAALPRHADEPPSFAEALHASEQVASTRHALRTLVSTSRTP